MLSIGAAWPVEVDATAGWLGWLGWLLNGTSFPLFVTLPVVDSFGASPSVVAGVSFALALIVPPSIKPPTTTVPIKKEAAPPPFFFLRKAYFACWSVILSRNIEQNPFPLFIPIQLTRVSFNKIVQATNLLISNTKTKPINVFVTLAICN